MPSKTKMKNAAIAAASAALPKIVNDLSWQKPARALAYFDDGGFWHMSRSSGAPNQSLADLTALTKCNLQAARRNSNKSCKLYAFAAKTD